jgi:hypothetical protein
MTIQSISPHSAVLYLDREELRQHGVCAHQLSARHALALTRRAFDQAGLSAPGTLELETYPAPRGVLIFAHVRPAARSPWRQAPAHHTRKRRRAPRGAP